MCPYVDKAYNEFPYAYKAYNVCPILHMYSNHIVQDINTIVTVHIQGFDYYITINLVIYVML